MKLKPNKFPGVDGLPNGFKKISGMGGFQRHAKCIGVKRQGCPISAILYLFIAEILSFKFKENVLKNF